MQQMGLQARLMSQALRKMSGNASKACCTLIFLNQIRYKVVFLVYSEFSICLMEYLLSLSREIISCMIESVTPPIPLLL